MTSISILFAHGVYLSKVVSTGIGDDAKTIRERTRRKIFGLNFLEARAVCPAFD